jgi:Zn-dependent protease/CBS domain-containing protein
MSGCQNCSRLHPARGFESSVLFQEASSLPKNTCLAGLFGHRARSVKWSYRVASVAGIQVRIHLTFLLLLGFYAWIYYTEGGAKAAVDGVAFTLLIFLCVLLHEFGHAFAAKAFGIRTPDITLLPIGGVARLERMPANPWQELIIAVAGPAVNVLIALVVLLLIGGVLPLHEFLLIDTASGSLLAKLFFVNMLLVAFNLIPAFPMDGGRVLRALLATQMRYVAATQLAARVGQVIAALFVVASLIGGPPMLGFIALFVFLGAQQELAYARLRETAQGLRVGQAMITRFHTLPTTLKVAEIAASLAGSTQRVFPFVDERLRLHGFANREELEKASHELPAQAPANCVARRLPAVGPDTRLEEALELMQQTSEPLLPVVNASGQIVGIVSVGHLAELAASTQPGLSL